MSYLYRSGRSETLHAPAFGIFLGKMNILVLRDVYLQGDSLREGKSTHFRERILSCGGIQLHAYGTTPNSTILVTGVARPTNGLMGASLLPFFETGFPLRETPVPGMAANWLTHSMPAGKEV